MKAKGMNKGGKLDMVEKNGKMVKKSQIAQGGKK